MSQALKIHFFILFLITIILLAGLNPLPLVNAQPTPTSLTIAVTSPPQGIPFSSECTIQATLKDENDKPLQNMDIDFYVCGIGCQDRIGTAKTDSNGVASLKFAFPRAETYDVKAMFSGTTDYTQSSSENILITIADYTPYLLGGGLLAVAIFGIAGYIVFRRRKKTIPSLLLHI